MGRVGSRRVHGRVKRVWVELSPAGKVIRIFRSKRAAVESETRIEQRPKAEAVEELRWNLFIAVGGVCERCGNWISWNSMHMHERVPRGKGGEQSLSNSQALCGSCHIGKSGVHRDRRLRSGTRNT